MKNLAALAVAIATITNPAQAQVNKVRPGFGDDPGQPVTQPFALPRGVRLDGPIMGVDAESGECKDKNLTVGSGGAVKVCAAFCMDNGIIIGADGLPIDIRNGLILNSQFRDGQNGLLVERVLVEMPYTPCGPGGFKEDEEQKKKRRKFIVQFNGYCLNESRSPSMDGMQYSIGGLTADPDMRELLAILAKKKVETEQHKSIVQTAIYSITEGRGLTEKDRWDLDGLPNKA